MPEEYHLIDFIEEAQYLLEDILLSGFYSIQNATLEKLYDLKEIFGQYDMTEGKRLLDGLYENLMKKKNSFDFDTIELAEIFSRLEFYLSTAKYNLE